MQIFCHVSSSLNPEGDFFFKLQFKKSNNVETNKSLNLSVWIYILQLGQLEVNSSSVDQYVGKLNL